MCHHSIIYGLQCLGCKAMTLKPQQRVSASYGRVRGKGRFPVAVHWFWQVAMIPVLPFVFDVMQCSVTFHSLIAEVH